MLTKKCWVARRKSGYITLDEWRREGWFLFGIIPLYVRDVTVRSR